MIGEDVGFWGYLFMGIVSTIPTLFVLGLFIDIDNPDWTSKSAGCGCMAAIAVAVVHVILFAFFTVAMFRFYILLIIFVVICIMAYGVFFKGKR